VLISSTGVSAIAAAFLASLVEFVEALTIVLAVGATRGWRSALLGAASGAAALALLVVAVGPGLARFPLAKLELIIGLLLLVFGMRWLRKAILRSAGVIGLHDEAAIFAKATASLRSESRPARPRQFDGIAVATSFKAVVLEGLEVVFIVIATGAGGMLVPASLGALFAGIVVISLGIAIRRPLSAIPENALKFAVGVLLSAFGVFWIGEGLSFPWPARDVSLFALIAGFAAVAFLPVAIIRSHTDGTATPARRQT